MQQFYTYLHCKPDLTPFYVGKGTMKRCRDFSRRNLHHKRVVDRCGGKKNIQVGISEIVSYPVKPVPSRWHEDLALARQLIDEAGIIYREINITQGEPT